MKLFVQNIGKIEEATIAIDGITVVTGDNDTGKSTVGKALYCLFALFHNSEEKIKEEKQQTLANLILSQKLNVPDEKTLTKGFYSVYKSSLDFAGELLDTQKADEDLFKKKIVTFMGGEDGNESNTSLENLYERYDSIYELSDTEILGQMLKNLLQNEFGVSDISRIGTEDSQIELTIKNRKLTLSQADKETALKVQQYLNLTKRIIYIDDPFILDNMGDKQRMGRGHRHALLDMLTEESRNTTAVSELVTQKKLETVMRKLRRICDGDLIRTEQDGYQYQSDSLHGAIPVKEVSTGIKSFLILKQLLMSGHLEEDGIVVLDEPEVHLHPQWQVDFAEIIVLLHQEFNINFLITTHSIDFLTALEFYSKRNNILEKCHFYMMEKGGNGGTVSRETSGHLDEAYAKLSEPFLDIIHQMEEET